MVRTYNKMFIKKYRRRLFFLEVTSHNINEQQYKFLTWYGTQLERSKRLEYKIFTAPHYWRINKIITPCFRRNYPALPQLKTRKRAVLGAINWVKWLRSEVMARRRTIPNWPTDKDFISSSWRCYHLRFAPVRLWTLCCLGLALEVARGTVAYYQSVSFVSALRRYYRLQKRLSSVLLVPYPRNTLNRLVTRVFKLGAKMLWQRIKFFCGHQILKLSVSRSQIR